ncbi:MAG: hypothetical protein KDC44_20955 [Phaeodactylibacter sp.]|nr:hypothetical protein [Phaeodactylibacter sp.]
MELKLKIGYKELLELIKQLPASQLAKLKSELTDKLIEEKTELEQTHFQKLLADGPVMNDEQYQRIVRHRESMNQWRTN